MTALASMLILQQKLAALLQDIRKKTLKEETYFKMPRFKFLRECTGTSCNQSTQEKLKPVNCRSKIIYLNHNL